MPTVAVNCPACGSPSTVEFKPENYICSHCDTKFKWTDPNVQKVVIEKRKCSCGQESIAECKSCGGAVCTQHKMTIVDSVKAEARQYFIQKILPALDWQDQVDDILCPQCLGEKGKQLQDKVELLKERGKLCKEKACFSMELIRCDSCGRSLYCNQHTPLRKKFKKSMFGSKSTAITYEKICESCYLSAKEKTGSVYWE